MWFRSAPHTCIACRSPVVQDSFPPSAVHIFICAYRNAKQKSVTYFPAKQMLWLHWKIHSAWHIECLKKLKIITLVVNSSY